jgi:transcriptional regulator with XRE-family HTH domain
MQQVMSDQQALEVIAENLRRFRGARSYSEIARACTTQDETAYPATIERIEKRKNMPGAGLLCRLAEALGVTVDDMLTPKIPSRIPA